MQVLGIKHRGEIRIVQVLCRKFGEFGEKEEGEREGDSEVVGKASLKLSSVMPLLLCSFSGSLPFVSLLFTCPGPILLSCPYTVFLTRKQYPLLLLPQQRRRVCAMWVLASPRANCALWCKFLLGFLVYKVVIIMVPGF